MIVKYHVFLGIAAIFLAGCGNDRAEEDAKIHEELKALRSEVAQIHVAISDIHRIALRSNQGPTAAPNSNIGATRMALDWDNDVYLGEDTANIAIVEFSDFQCPFCARYHQQTFAAIKKDYIDTGKIKYVLKDYPLGFHSEAVGAAIAANCAAEQDAYWSMRDDLFQNQRQLSPQLYSTLAQKNELDMQKFEACTNSSEQKAKIDESASFGQQLAVNGTPHFFIGNIENGQLVNIRRVAGAQPLSSFARVIDSL